MSNGQLFDPCLLWPDLTGWDAVGMAEAVYRVRTESGADAYVRPDDGSASLLRRLRAQGIVPIPEVLDVRDGWLLLGALPGVPLHETSVWRNRPHDVARIIAEALRLLEQAGVTHGDLCLPNILGDPGTGRLTGLVDWRYAERFGREVDVAAAVWSSGYNGFGINVAIEILRECDWPIADAEEVERLRKVWLDLPMVE